MLLVQLVGVAFQTVVVRGLPGSQLSIPFIREGIKIYNHLLAEEMNELLNSSEYIVARSGYSTIMDLVNKKRNAILVPTPGQTEQEYLGLFARKKMDVSAFHKKNSTSKMLLKEFKKRMIWPNT